jgi:hypothetical protein
MKTKAKIEQTTNYGLFTYHENQQPMSPVRVRRVIESMRSTGFWPSKPIGVYRSAGKLVIIDGHHRFEAAKTLGLPIIFVEEPKSHEHLIGVANSIVGTWKNESFAKLYASRGNRDYEDLLFYVERGIPLKQASSLLCGESAHSGNSGQRVRHGTFKIKTDKYINAVLCIIDTVKEVAPEITKRAYIDALSLLLFLPEFDQDVLIKRIQAHPTGIVRCADKSQALEALEEVYNFRAREKTPLAFLAKDAARKRGLTGIRPRR